MAVWGTPTATEDDAERAVRAALDLVAAVTALGDEIGAPDLRARAGVLTGEAAVTLGAEGEGMVAGDLVNTASRIQALAEPGTVLVGEATRRATEQTVAYEDAGAHELKGKVGPDPALARAAGRLRRSRRAEVAGPRGAVRRAATASCARSRISSTPAPTRAGRTSSRSPASPGSASRGWAGSSTSTSTGSPRRRTGTAAAVSPTARASPTGRSPTWCGCARGSSRTRSPAPRSPSSRAVVEEHIADPDERRFVEPRLAHLLGLEEASAGDREDLFAAWRLFFERLAVVYPVVMLFEDMQWADASLLDFIEYLLEWGRNSPILVVTQARPELLERRPTWGAGHRNFTSLYLEPLSAEAMEELLDRPCPGPARRAARTQILARAEGVPLYAVETVRMLLDRGALVQEGPSTGRPARSSRSRFPRPCTR